MRPQSAGQCWTVMLIDRVRCTGMKILRKSCNSLCNIIERSVIVMVSTDT